METSIVASLPEEILIYILDHLPALSDFFSCVIINIVNHTAIISEKNSLDCYLKIKYIFLLI
jgi:hypothetical protein